MGALLGLSRLIDTIVNGIGKTAAFLFIPMMAIISYDIAQRKYLDFDPLFADSALSHFLSSTRLQEMEWHLHSVLFLLCLGFAYVRDSHVRIELVRDQLLPETRAWIEIFGCVLFLIPYCWVVTEMGYKFALSSYGMSEVSSAQTGLTHRWIIKAMLPVGFVLLGISAVSVMLKCIVFLFGPASLRREASSHVMSQHEHMEEDAKKELEELERAGAR